jgi:type VI secretion system FHA domain protein
MYVSLEVVSPQAASMGADRRRLVGPTGLTIGRVPGNDWVIPDPYISQQHARISFVNGAFFVEGLGRNPIAIGRSDNTLPSRQPRRLNNGDHLFVDQYEIIITIHQGDMPGTVAAPPPVVPEDDPFALIDPVSSERAPATTSEQSGIPERWDENPAWPSVTETATLDPLDVFEGSREAAPPEAPPVNWQQASPLRDNVSLPPVPPTRPGSGGIPDNWERTGLTHIEHRAVESATPVPPPTPTPAPRRPSRSLRTSTPPSTAAATESVRPVARSAAVPPPPTSPDPSANLPPRAGPSMPPAASLEFVELLRGAGLADRDMSPETLQELGKALRVVVQGLMEVLQARTEIKSQFRLPLTRVKAAENNPLKLSPNVESALHTLLVQRNAGYLGTVAAFEDAFADIRAHQLAMLEGMRAAFDSMLNSFTPAELEKHFERAVKRGGILGGLSGKSKYWDLYVEHVGQLCGDPEDTFRRLFGEVFAEAYEKQLERLRTIARHSSRG